MPWKNPRPNRNDLPSPPPSPPPPPQFDPAIFQAVVIAAVATSMSQIGTNSTGGSGSGAMHSNHGDSVERVRVCSYKDFMNGKPDSFNGTRGVVTLMQWSRGPKHSSKSVLAPKRAKSSMQCSLSPVELSLGGMAELSHLLPQWLTP